MSSDHQCLFCGSPHESTHDEFARFSCGSFVTAVEPETELCFRRTILIQVSRLEAKLDELLRSDPQRAVDPGP